MVTLNKAYARLANLSEERARRVLSLIEDLIAARKVLAHPDSVPWKTLKPELDELHR